MRQLLILFTLLSFTILSFTSCENSSDAEEGITPEALSSLKKEVLEGYASIVYASYLEAHNKAVALQSTVNTFTTTPTATSFEAVKTAWLASREPYGQTEAYRFYNGPIDNETNGPEGQINAWPLDEGFIDYVQGNDNAGIVNDLSLTIDKATLINKNEQDGVETNVATGYHAIEFLLWGQDLTSPVDKKAGQRSFTDYTTKTNADRRKQYLTIATDLLVEDLAKLVAAWAPNQSNYRATFANDVDKALTNILTGIGTLSNGELSGERMNVALLNHDQEDEHSCFSDNTHRDIVTNALGIYNIYMGTYGTVKVKGLQVLINTVDPELATAFNSEATNTIEKVKAIQSPFDYEISADNPTGNQRVKDAIQALKAQATLIEKTAEKLKLTITTDV